MVNAINILYVLVFMVAVTLLEAKNIFGDKKEVKPKVVYSVATLLAVAIIAAYSMGLKIPSPSIAVIKIAESLLK